MKLLPRPVLGALRLLFLLSLLPLIGCGRHAATRPASSLSDKDRTLLDRYEEIREALAKDDLRSAKRAGAAMSKFLKDAPFPGTSFAADADGIGAAVALDRARQSFEPMSKGIAKLADGVEGYYVFDTPIPDGAEWVQRTTQTDNPYTGKAMHDIGTLKK